MPICSVSTGTIKQPITVHIDYSHVISFYKEVLDKIDSTALIELLTTILADAIMTAISPHVDSIELDDHDDTEIGVISYPGTYTTTYVKTTCSATRDTPAECDITRKCEQLPCKHIEKKLISSLPEYIKYFITISIDENENDAEFEDYEPDWDSMPGGYDN